MKSLSNWTFPSNIELYYAPESAAECGEFYLPREEALHAIRVMRHKPQDRLYVTNGKGIVFLCTILTTTNTTCYLRIDDIYYSNKTAANITFYIPSLKNTERMEFALEKLVEIGYTNFVFYRSDRSVKTNFNAKRLEKIAFQAIKQSLNVHACNIIILNELELSTESEIWVFDQHYDMPFKKAEYSLERSYSLVFGPEGGMSEREQAMVSTAKKLKLAENRLRSETAIILAGAQLRPLIFL